MHVPYRSSKNFQLGVQKFEPHNTMLPNDFNLQGQYQNWNWMLKRTVNEYSVFIFRKFFI
jgi:hypothetical protein